MVATSMSGHGCARAPAAAAGPPATWFTENFTLAAGGKGIGSEPPRVIVPLLTIAVAVDAHPHSPPTHSAIRRTQSNAHCASHCRPVWFEDTDDDILEGVLASGSIAPLVYPHWDRDWAARLRDLPSSRAAVPLRVSALRQNPSLWPPSGAPRTTVESDVAVPWCPQCHSRDAIVIIAEPRCAAAGLRTAGSTTTPL